MDFAIFPPEINSTRIYGGPGSGSLLAAAGSWDALAAELSAAAEAYGSVLSTLTNLHWHGPASESMAATAAPYLDWLNTTAQQTKQTAIQARAAATAFEQTYALTVPPPLITANRTLLQSLIATNFFGQNTAAIAATEAQYAEMWAQDATAMNGYATSSAAATQLAPFSLPQQTTDPDGLTAQSAAVNQALSTVASNAQSTLSQIVSSLSQTLSSLTSAPADLVPDDLTLLDGFAGAYSSIISTQAIEQFCAGIVGTEKNLGLLDAVKGLPSVLPEVIPPPPAPSPGLVGTASGAGLLNEITASLSRANSIGQLSVPAAWTAPSTSTVSALTPAGLTTLPGTDEAVGSGIPGIPGMPAGSVARASGVLPRYGTRLTVMTRPPAGG